MPFVRMLNDDGIKRFRDYLSALRSDPCLPPPFEILHDGNYSDPFEPPIEVKADAFADAYEFGTHLVHLFASCEDRLISRNHGLWCWLALLYFDHICRPDAEGKRKILQDALYLLSGQYNFRTYYRHLVRTPWLAVKEHGKHAKVLLITGGRGARSDIAEQLGAQQFLFGNSTFIEAAYAMYFDEATQKPRRGTSGKLGGSPRRLASVARQLELTYDLRSCGRNGFLCLLPRAEFRRWIDAAIGVATTGDIPNRARATDLTTA